ncbi:MAG: PDZ domain-containing protein [Bacteriovoracaceae bacterium]|nr:PDZ domain-containing protein [Bacteriovoracaceae bacterium]
MKVSYLVEITQPELHLVKVTLTSENKGNGPVEIFLPSWSPGSYLMREYSRHIRWVRATQSNGEVLWVEQTAKGTWIVDWNKSQLKNVKSEFSFSYEIYLHELTVRTSHVDNTHAFLHGPSYLMAIVGGEKNPTIEFRFPPLWSKLSTSMDEVKGMPREKFIYEASDYDVLIDHPVEIGCQETDGFMLKGVPHGLAFYGEQYPHGQDLKKDMMTAINEVAETMGEIPFTHYQFITHFAPKLYGGLEHLNSTALHFDGRRLNVRKDYLAFLSLTAHEYFHAWNVKRIRPKALGPFDYRNEGYTSMLWLAEGLTSFMDDLFIYRSGLATLEDYLEMIKGNFENYFSTPGRKFHSLEDSSFNAWIKLYRPDENSKNSSISYYLKGGLVFMILHTQLKAKGKSVDDLLKLLWNDYKTRPETGVTKEQVYSMVKELGGDEILANFQTMIETTQDLDLEGAVKKMGLELVFNDGAPVWLGADFDSSGERSIVRSVNLDSPAAKSGLNAGDEIIAINGLRVLKEDTDKWSQHLKADHSYELIVSRLGKLTKLDVMFEKGPRTIKEIKIVDRSLAEKMLMRVKA